MLQVKLKNVSLERQHKLLLKNQAHDGICGCSTDDVHSENITRYKKVIQLAETILKELKFLHKKDYEKKLVAHNKKYRSVMEFEGTTIPKNSQVISKRKGFVDEILYDTQKIPITEDYTTIYKYLKEIKTSNIITLFTGANDHINNNALDTSKFLLRE